MTSRVEILRDLPRCHEGILTVPVGIPAHNSEARIGGVIRNLGRQPLPENSQLRVVVVANGCKDKTAEVASHALDTLAKNGAECELIVKAEGSQAKALNTIAEHFAGETKVIELQDDSFPSMGAVGLLALYGKQYPELGAVGTNTRPLPTHMGNLGTFTESVVYAGRRTFENQSFHFVDRLALWSPQVVGEFPSLISVDNYMMYQSLKNGDGYGVVSEDLARVYYRLPKSMKEMWEQKKMYERGHNQICKMFPDYESVLAPTYANTFKKRRYKGSWLVDALKFQERGIRVEHVMFALGIQLIISKAKKIGLDWGEYSSDKRDRIWSSV